MKFNPLFQVMLALQNLPLNPIELPGLTLSPIKLDLGSAKMDLTLWLRERPDGLKATLAHNVDLFTQATSSRILDCFYNLLQAIAEDPGQRISRLGGISETDRHLVLIQWNNTRSETLEVECVQQLFEAQVERTPDAVAVLFDGGQLTYRELNSRANRLAHHLRCLGIGAETLVGIALERSPELIVALLGVLKAGATYVPLDPEYPLGRLAFMIEDAKPKVLLTQASVVKSWAAASKAPLEEATDRQLPISLCSETVPPTMLCLDSDWDAIGQASEENPQRAVGGLNRAYVIYTSGSTGRPKGVEVVHAGLTNFVSAANCLYDISSKDRVLQFASISFDAAAEEIFPCLTRGATLVLRTDSLLDSAAVFIEKCHEWKLTILDLPTAYWQTLMTEMKTLRLKLPAAVRLVIIGGESALAGSLSDWREYAGPEMRLLNTYGPTEATVVATAHESNKEDRPSARGEIPIGHPILNTQVYLLDSCFQPVPIGAVGELCIGGSGLARGYLNRPELTAEKFIPNPFGGMRGSRLYRTGDLARYRQDGTLEFQGRLDRQVKIRGFRIELGEIEAALGQHPGVQRGVTIVREEPGRDKRLVAYAVARSGEPLQERELIRFLKSRLPDYMVPSAIVQLNAMPLTPSGKLDRSALPAPVSDASRGGGPAALRTPVEEVIADIWSQILGVETVGRYDNFFQLGGHSLLGTRVVSRIRQAFKIDFPLRLLFQFQTLASLAERVEATIRRSQALAIPPLRAMSRGQNIPLSFMQQGLWFLDQLEPGNPFYNIHSGVRMRGSLNQEALEKALGMIAARHEILRTIFPGVDGVPVQVVSPAAAIPLSVVDLAELSPADREAEARRLATEEARRAFDLSCGPLLRTTLLRLEEQENILLLTMHHIVSDGWSMGVFYRELAALYEAFCRGGTASLPDLPIQYADYVLWQRQWLRDDILEEQLTYWRKRLEGAPALLEMSTDYPRPAIQRFHGASRPLMLSPQLTEALKMLSRRQGATLFMTLLTAFKALLYSYTGQEDLVVGSPVAGRNHVDTENLIGFFVNMLVLRTDMSGNPPFSELLRRVQRNALDAYSHADLPFEKLIEELQLKRSLSHNPLFQVMFALQNTQASPAELTGLELSPFRVNKGASKFDLSLGMIERNGVLRGQLGYDTDLFSEATIASMEGHFQNLLQAVVANPEERLSNLGLEAAVRETLPVPKSDSLARTASGQVDRPALPESATGGLQGGRPLVRPTNPIEQLLSEIWTQVLGKETVSIHDDFFELGGHSLLATRLVSRVQKAFGVEFSLRSVFERSTLEQMATVIAGLQVDQSDREEIAKTVADVERSNRRLSVLSMVANRK